MFENFPLTRTSNHQPTLPLQLATKTKSVFELVVTEFSNRLYQFHVDFTRKFVKSASTASIQRSPLALLPSGLKKRHFRLQATICNGEMAR